jgi:hypothetical protein
LDCCKEAKPCCGPKQATGETAACRVTAVRSDARGGAARGDAAKDCCTSDKK